MVIIVCYVNTNLSINKNIIFDIRWIITDIKMVTVLYFFIETRSRYS